VFPGYLHFVLRNHSGKIGRPVMPQIVKQGMSADETCSGHLTPCFVYVWKSTSMEESSIREADSRSATYFIIPRLLWNSKCYYCVHKISSLDCISSQFNPVRIFIYYDSILQLASKTKLRGFSPQANYTDPATAACRRS
jgi:hypothetical protein